MMVDDDLLTTDEVLGFLRVNRVTTYRLAKAGKIPAVHVGRVWRFLKKELEAWLKAGGTRQLTSSRRDASIATLRLNALRRSRSRPE